MLNEKYGQYSAILDRTARKVKQYAQASFASNDFDLTVDQWVAIKALYNESPLTHGALAEKCGKDRPTMTRIVDILIKKDLSRRIEHPSDRRCLRLELTEAGVEKVERLAPKVAAIRMKAWENLSDEDFAHFERILNTIYANLTDS